MGMRAAYVVVRDGRWSLHSSHWGAARVATDLAYGPAAAIRCLTANPAVEEAHRTAPDHWLDDVWCEGGALVDADRKVLLWFGHRDDGWAEYAAHRAVLARTWPGWEIRWACDGLGDFTAYLGLGRGFLRGPGTGDREEGAPAWWVAGADDETETLITVRREDGAVRAWACVPSVDSELAGGPGLLGLLPDGTPPPVLTVMPGGGLHFDLRTRTLGVWTTGTVPGVHDWPLPAGGDDHPGWEGWTLDFWGEDHRPHAALAAGTLAFPDRPDLRPALRAWRDRLDLPPYDPSGVLTLAAASAPGGADGTPPLEVVLNPAATVPHTPGDPTPQERIALAAAFGELLGEPT
jgi:hypothetical protein